MKTESIFASTLRRVFDFVSKTTVLTLFDEVDALTKDRGDGADHGELKRAVNAVLQMMDGYRGSSVLVATTNYESLLDRAVWRRFDEIGKTVWKSGNRTGESAVTSVMAELFRYPSGALEDVQSAATSASW